MKKINNKLFHEIDIEINSACNRTCWYCPNENYKRKEVGEMNEIVFNKVINDLKELDYKGKICFHFYNEPLLSPKLVDYVKLCKQELSAVIIELVSNGILLTKEKFDQLILAGVDIFTITKHDGVSILGIEKFLERYPDEIKRRISVKPSNELKLTNRSGLIPLEKKSLFPLIKPCYIPSCVTVVTVKGNVLTCYEDYSQNIEMGNVLQNSIEKIWNSERYVQFREDLKKGLRGKYILCSECDNVKFIV